MAEVLNMVPARDVFFYALGDEGVLFCEGTQQLHALNAPAARIWSGLQSGLTAPAIAGALESAFDLSPDEARGFVADIAASWRELGLLRGSEAGRPAAPPRRPAFTDRAAAGDALRQSAAPMLAERRYRLLGTAFRLLYTAVEAADRVHQILGHLSDDASTAADIVLEIVTTAAGHEVRRDGRSVRACAGDAASIGPLIKGLVWEIAVNRHGFFLDIHAGVLRSGLSCLLLPGASGSGKSCLAAALSCSGFAYLSDEVALLMHDMRVVATPLSLCIKTGAWDIVGRYRPDLVRLPIHRREDGKLVRYLPPPQASLGASGAESWPIRWIIFPRFESGTKTALRPVGTIEAMGRLLAQCVALPDPLTRQSVGRLVAWMGGLRCWDLAMSSLDEAVDLVQGAVRSPN